MLRPTGTHLAPSAETQGQDAGAAPASKPGKGQAEGNRPDLKILPYAEGLIVPFYAEDIHCHTNIGEHNETKRLP